MTQAVNGVDKKRKCNMNRMLFVVAGIFLPIMSFFVFWLYVNFSSFLLAFQKPKTYEWSLTNFVQFWDELTREGGSIKIAVKNTFVYFTKDLIMLFINLIVAFFLYKKVFMYKAFRVIFYMPAIISSVVMTTVYAEFIKPQGPLGAIMNSIGHPLPVEGLFGTVETATPTIVAYTIWVGFTGMLLFHGSLARIPNEVIEAARLDGCGPFRECASIVFPLIWPMFSTLFIFQMTGLFGASGPILLFTQGSYETTTISYWIFAQVYGTGGFGGSGMYGLVSAAGLCFSAVGMPIILLTRWIVEKIPTVEY